MYARMLKLVSCFSFVTYGYVTLLIIDLTSSATTSTFVAPSTTMYAGVAVTFNIQLKDVYGNNQFVQSMITHSAVCHSITHCIIVCACVCRIGQLTKVKQVIWLFIWRHHHKQQVVW
jgi:hypothetical protein